VVAIQLLEGVIAALLDTAVVAALQLDTAVVAA